MLKYGAAQLLLHEARRINPRFELHDLDVPHVVQVCHLTQGLPLALELAATWLRVLKLSDVVEEIKSALDFLSGGRRDAGARHASMRAVFEHSWSLLSPSEQTTLRNLAVFRGGFTSTAAAEVAGASLADLAALVDKSLLRVSSGGRYDRHPLLYQFTLEKLGEHPEELRVARERHGAFYLQLLTEFGSVWDRHPKAAMDTLALELENVRALNWAVPARASHDELRVAVAALGIYFDMCGQYGAGLELFNRLSHLWEPHGQAGELTAQVWCGGNAPGLTSSGVASIRR
ncbi:hypothetical protein LAJ19_20865 (plasmid) [Deinococcus taeanensis]|uniref:ATP-binding protein n=1 Tax=Deinococcus taeanensis TaxID=2737050 RepID=UPI001CDBFA7A|nr:hypothetical protein [Deinococcus taeanensis]UBV45252.1 hypothetical protein LAJ19_20865 [Deinococcus taeanensis]